MLLKFLVSDEFGEPLRKFYTRQEAEWFITSRPNCTVKQIATEQRETFADQLDKYGDAPF